MKKYIEITKDEEILQKALEIAKEIKDDEYKSEVLANIAIITKNKIG